MVKNLKALRTQNKVSQQQLASVLGLSQQSINKYENHNVEPDIATLIAMADYFHTTVDHLVGREPSKEEPLCVSIEEQALLANIRKLTTDEQLFLSKMIRSYLSERS